MHPTDTPTKAQAEYLRRAMKAQTAVKGFDADANGASGVMFCLWVPGREQVGEACARRGWIYEWSALIYHVTNNGRAALARYDAKQKEAK